MSTSRRALCCQPGLVFSAGRPQAVHGRVEVAKDAFTKAGANTSLDDIARQAGWEPARLAGIEKICNRRHSPPIY